MKINVLPTEIANMIAAGEVVERPASVVKELAENSIDAGATSITVEIKKGGMTFIRISDNGCGIDSGEVVTAFMRHATSKIKTESDLNSIYTLGFRGEALASIAAVARVDIFTKPKEQAHGYSASIEGGAVVNEDVSGCPDGTTITVRDLFFNTPARMKFLKNDATETGYVTDTVNKLILSHPEVAFHLINNGKTVVRSHGDGKLINAIYAVFGRDYARNMTEIEFSDDNIRVSGFIGNASIARKDRRHQIFYINGRNISSKILSSSVGEACKNTLMTGKFPVVVLSIELNTSFVDVNVHPTKMEVRFSDDKKIYHSVYWAVKNALSGTKYIPEINTEPKKVMPAPAYDTPRSAERSEINLLKDEYVRSAIPAAKTYDTPVPKSTVLHEPKPKPQISPASKNVEKEYDFSAQAEIKEESKIPENTRSEIPERFAVKTQEEPISEKPLSEVMKQTIPIKEEIQEKTAPEKEPVSVEYQPEPQRPQTPQLQANIDFRIAGQVFNTYIIVQKDNDMLIIDQHAAHERLYFEEFMEEYKSKSVKPQVLLIPITMDFAPVDFATVSANMDFFRSLGYDMDIFGDTSIIIRQIPYYEEEHIVRDTVDEIVGLISKHSVDIKKELFEEVLHTMACKRAVKGNHELSKQEIESLCERVLSLPDINTCPHGRPIMTKMSKYQLEKQFKRIV
ncbi:MAG: DNA mismatch repair endonuclease MutL [Clostridia bacterium]|nr:DNA mismatch repair endonuclease MutL [Clostridia bacterium]